MYGKCLASCLACTKLLENGTYYYIQSLKKKKKNRSELSSSGLSSSVCANRKVSAGREAETEEEGEDEVQLPFPILLAHMQVKGKHS